MTIFMKIISAIGWKGVKTIIELVCLALIVLILAHLQAENKQLTAKLKTTTQSLIKTTAELNQTVAAYKKANADNVTATEAIAKQCAASTKAAVRAASVLPAENVKLIVEKSNENQAKCPVADGARAAFSLHDIQASFND